MIIASAPTLFEQARQHLEQDAVLQALLTDGVYPRAGESPEAAAGCYLLLRELPDAPRGRAEINRVSFVVEAHERDIGQDRWRIKPAIQRVEILFDLREWQEPTDDLRDPLKSYWTGTVGPVPDEAWHTNKYLGSFEVDAV